MNGWIAHHEPLMRAGVFVSVVLLVIGWEFFAPFRQTQPANHKRQGNNLLLMVLNTVLMRFAIPMSAVGLAASLPSKEMGFFNQLGLPAWAEIVLAVVLLDLVLWLQHRLFHTVPWLWRLHRVHHADLQVDWTTGVRFHPVEHIISLAIKLGAVMIIGPAVIAVILFEVMLNATSMFNHANGRLTAHLDRWLQWFIVTPSLHRIHHSTDPAEQRVNFGFNLTLWDRLAGSLLLPEARASRPLIQGVSEFPEVQMTTPITAMLLMPFINSGHREPPRE